MDNRNPIISIIIPCYNAEQYIEKTLVTLLKNTIIHKCEIVIINDGSTDSTDKKICSFISNNTKISFIYRTIQNSGVSVARNIGIKVARGEYIAFLDADDLYSDFFLEALYKSCKRGDSFCSCLWSNNEEHLYQNLAKSKRISKKDFLNRYLYRTKPQGLWTGLYKKKIIDEYSIEFPREVKYGEDLYFLWSYMLHCEEFRVIEEKLYYYRTVETSAMSRATWEKTSVIEIMYDIKEQIAVVYPEYLRSFSNYMIPRTILSLQKDFAKSKSFHMFNRLKDEKKKEKYWYLVSNGKISVRICGLIYCISPRLFYSLISKS